MEGFFSCLLFIFLPCTFFSSLLNLDYSLLGLYFPFAGLHSCSATLYFCFAGLDSRLAGLNSCFAVLDSRLAGLNSCSATLCFCFAGLHSRLAGLHSCFVALYFCFAGLNSCLVDLHFRLGDYIFLLQVFNVWQVFLLRIDFKHAFQYP